MHLCNIYGTRTRKEMFTNYRRLAKEGPWAVHLTLGSEWGVGGHSRSIIVALNAKERPVFPGEAYHAE